ncbi:YncE family protein [Antrihabitans spumae]|uniref:YncE family protein n=1 Tax=Antrihabitans spumae TaxID=3373370 RepID=A0ABW7K4V4_9NOCA
MVRSNGRSNFIGLRRRAASLGRTMTLIVAVAALSSGNVVAQADSVSGSIPIDEVPGGLTLAPNGGRAYVTNPNGKITIIDTANNVPVGKLGFGGYAIAIAPNGTRAYVTGRGNTVEVFDPTTNLISAPAIDVGGTSKGLAITRDGARAYVANSSRNSVTVIDVASNSIVTDIADIDSPISVSTSPNTPRAYVSTAKSVVVIDTNTNTVVTSIEAGARLTGITTGPNGTRVYAADTDGNSVQLIDMAANTLVGSIPVGTAPAAIAFSPDGTRAYVTNSGSDTVSVINTTNNTVIETLGVGAGPSAIAMIPNGSRAYVANIDGRSVSVITRTKGICLSVCLPSLF